MPRRDVPERLVGLVACCRYCDRPVHPADALAISSWNEGDDIPDFWEAPDPYAVAQGLYCSLACVTSDLSQHMTGDVDDEVDHDDEEEFLWGDSDWDSDEDWD